MPRKSMSDNQIMNANRINNPRIIAAKLLAPPDEKGLPPSAAWDQAMPVVFCSDWRGENADPQRETEARLLWSFDHLFIRFRCRYRNIYVYDGKGSRRDKLWMRDVAEVFIQRGADELRRYREFEISPNGDWLDLEIYAGEKSFIMCDLKSRVVCTTHEWIAEMAVPMHCLTPEFNPDETWRLNLFRIEGCEPHRFYSAWRPTYTLQPNFHVPEQFGELCFSPS
jgi:hypothetical protein